MVINPRELSLEERAKILREKIIFGDFIRNSYLYTGIYGVLGGHCIENTGYAADQLVFALAMSRHPLIDEILLDDKIDSYTFKFEPLIEAKVLNGMRILDLGCGRKPTFARFARFLGADVYTNDRESSDKFIFDEDHFPPKYRLLEQVRHIQLDLWGFDAAQKILESTGGDFHLVTEALLEDCGFSNGDEIALPLLRIGGIYFKADDSSNPESIKYLVKTDSGLVLPQQALAVFNQ